MLQHSLAVRSQGTNTQLYIAALFIASTEVGSNFLESSPVLKGSL